MNNDYELLQGPFMNALGLVLATSVCGPRPILAARLLPLL